MATVDTHTAAEAGGHQGGSLYDGFISYSHAADDLLAPRLQAGLQRFAKPWWKRRALRMFRDESSLSANPHLWSSITDALDTSDWFVLLLSPDAADSEWVNQEVEYWLDNKDPERIIPVLTDGEFRWTETDIDLESTAAPPALYGAFSDEPRWVDLRFARSEEQLDLNNPRFSAAVADIASAIRGVPKDELESEEVRQHRRTVRTAWGAAAGLLTLALIAGAAALFALDQRNDATTAAAAEAEQRQIAEDNATLAEQGQQQAEAARAEAEAAQTEAEQARDVAQAGKLVLEAEKVVEQDPELSAHLALAALATLRSAGEDYTQAESALRAAIANDRVTFRVPGGDFVTVHPNGELLATADLEDGAIAGVAVWDIATREVVERYAREGGTPLNASFSPDGTLLAVAFAGVSPAVTVWDRTTGESFDMGPERVGNWDFVFSPDGTLLALEQWVDADELGNDIFMLGVWSVQDDEAVYTAAGYGPDFNSDGVLVYVADPLVDVPDIVIADPLSGEIINRIDTGGVFPTFSAWSPDGTRIGLTDSQLAIVIDLETGQELLREEFDRANSLEWVTDDVIVIGGESDPKVIDADSGEVLAELLGQPGSHLYGLELVPDTTRVASAVNAEAGSGVVIFETSPVGGVEIGGWMSPIDTDFSAGFVTDGSRIFLEDGDNHLTANALDGSDAVVVPGTGQPFGEDGLWFPDMDPGGNFVWHGTPGGTWVVRSFETDEVIYEAPDGFAIAGVSGDGTKAVISDFSSNVFCGKVQVVSTADGSRVDLDSSCIGYTRFSPDAALVNNGRGDADALATALFDTESGDLLRNLGGTRYAGLGHEFTPDGSKLVVGSFSGLLSVLDVGALLSGAEIEEAVDVEREGAHSTLILRMPISPDGTRVATSAAGDPLKLWDLNTGDLLGSFGSGGLLGAHLGDFHPTEPWLMVTTWPNIVRIHTLDIDELTGIAESGLSREMTGAECQQYFDGPCPTP